MAGQRLILLVDRVLKSRTFWRWAGVPLGIAGLAAAGFMMWDTDHPGVDPGTRNVQLEAAGVVGLVGLVLLCFGGAAWVPGRGSPHPPAAGGPGVEQGPARDRGRHPGSARHEGHAGGPGT
jgi:hypothetical protein